MNEHLSDNQWEISCTKLNHLIQQISYKTQETCSAPPLPPLTHRTTQQRDFLPRKLQKQWKKHLTTYHLIRKTIYITKVVPNWQNHPIMDELNNHNYITIPPPPHPDDNPQEWIETLAELAKTANKQARKHNIQTIHQHTNTNTINIWRKIPNTTRQSRRFQSKTKHIQTITTTHSSLGRRQIYKSEYISSIYRLKKCIRIP